MKRSVWLKRRAKVVQDGVTHDEISPVHIPERLMVADPNTEYLKFDVWDRHMQYMLNYTQSHPSLK